MYNINESIPGWSSFPKLETLAKLASLVPADGLIVELGSFCGRSAYAMGMNKKESATLLCVDMFIPMFTGVPVKNYDTSGTCYGDTAQVYCFETFVNNTKHIVNLETLAMTLPYNDRFIKITEPIDLLFVDASHSYEAVSADIRQWVHCVKPGGVIVFDDYFDLFPGCMQAVDEFVKKHNLTLEVVEYAAIVKLPSE